MVKFALLEYISMEEEKKSLNFIEQIIEEDLANGLEKIRSVSVSHQNRMVIYTLATQRLFVSTLVWVKI